MEVAGLRGLFLVMVGAVLVLLLFSSLALFRLRSNPRHHPLAPLRQRRHPPLAADGLGSEGRDGSSVKVAQSPTVPRNSQQDGKKQVDTGLYLDRAPPRDAVVSKVEVTPKVKAVQTPKFTTEGGVSPGGNGKSEARTRTGVGRGSKVGTRSEREIGSSDHGTSEVKVTQRARTQENSSRVQHRIRANASTPRRRRKGKVAVHPTGQNSRPIEPGHDVRSEMTSKRRVKPKGDVTSKKSVAGEGKVRAEIGSAKRNIGVGPYSNSSGSSSGSSSRSGSSSNNHSLPGGRAGMHRGKRRQRRRKSASAPAGGRQGDGQARPGQAELLIQRQEGGVAARGGREPGDVFEDVMTTTPTSSSTTPTSRPATPPSRPAAESSLRSATLPSRPATPPHRPAEPASGKDTPISRSDTPPHRPAEPASGKDTPISRSATPPHRPAELASGKDTPISRPATPSNGPPAPVFEKDTPPFRPATPISRTEASRPDKPSSGPVSPASDKDTPTSRPATPSSEEDASVSTPVAPAFQEDTPTSRPATSTYLGRATPSYRPATPTFEEDASLPASVAPVLEEDAPTSGSATPTFRPATPTSRPDTPTSRSDTPTSGSATPIYGSATPPISKADKPLSFHPKDSGRENTSSTESPVTSLSPQAPARRMGAERGNNATSWNGVGDGRGDNVTSWNGVGDGRGDNVTSWNGVGDEREYNVTSWNGVGDGRGDNVSSWNGVGAGRGHNVTSRNDEPETSTVRTSLQDASTGSYHGDESKRRNNVEKFEQSDLSHGRGSDRDLHLARVVEPMRVNGKPAASDVEGAAVSRNKKSSSPSSHQLQWAEGVEGPGHPNSERSLNPNYKPATDVEHPNVSGDDESSSPSSHQLQWAERVEGREDLNSESSLAPSPQHVGNKTQVRKLERFRRSHREETSP